MKTVLSVIAGLLIASGAAQPTTLLPGHTLAGTALASGQKILKPGESYTDPKTGNVVKNDSFENELTPGHPQIFLKLRKDGSIEKVIVNSSETNGSIEIDATHWPVFPVEVWGDGWLVEYEGDFNHFLYNYGDNNVWHLHGNSCELFNGYDGIGNAFFSIGVNNQGHDSAPSGSNYWDYFPGGSPWIMN